MRKYRIEIELLSPLHLGSGHQDVIVDAEVMHDRWGLPFFPGKRLKGLLYESALELAEISGGKWFTVYDVKKLFAQQQNDEWTAEESGLVVENFNLPDHEELCKGWEYLNQQYNGIFTSQEVWDTYTELRSQTAINPETGTAETTTLHNMKVVDAGIKFLGCITIKDSNEMNDSILTKSLINLRYAGTKRNRGFGHIKCTLLDSEEVH